MRRRVGRLLPLCSALLLWLGAAPPATASLDDQVVYSANAGGKILKLDFTGGTSVVVNADAAQHHQFDGLVVRDDLRAIHLVAADRRGKVLFYADAAGTGELITNKLPGPAGLTLDADGNLFLVSPSKASFFGLTRYRAWTIPRGGSHPGGYGDPVLLGTLPPRVRPVATKVVPTSDGRLRERDLLVLTNQPAGLFRFHRVRGRFRAEALIAPSVFPAGSHPTGLAFSPTGEILVTTLEGVILRFDVHGARLTPDFASPNVALNGISVGPQGGSVRAFVSADASVMRFNFQPDGTGVLDTSVSQGVNRATAASNAAALGAPTRVAALLRVLPHPDSEVTYDDVSGFGLTRSRMFEFQDNRGGAIDQGLHAFFPGDTDLQARIPDITIPSYVQAFPKRRRSDPPGGPYTGPPTFVLTVADTTSSFSRTAQLHIDESHILGYQPSCNDDDSKFRPRTFHAPETDPPKSEPPAVEGAVFTDVSTGCGSNIGRGSNFSLWLTARDTRATSAIVIDKLDKLDAALLFYSPLITSSTLLANLQAASADARSDFVGGTKGTAITTMEDFIDQVDAGVAVGDFTADPANVPGELISRAHSIDFMIGQTLNLTPIDLMVGDDDGYGQGIEDEGDLPNDGQTAFDRRSPAEKAANDGSEQTDVYTALKPAPASSFDVTFALPSRLYQGRLTIDMGGFEGTKQLGAVEFDFNGFPQSAMVFDDDPGETRVRHFELSPGAIANANAAGAFVVTVKRTSPGDDVAFDYFRLQGLVGP